MSSSSTRVQLLRSSSPLLYDGLLRGGGLGRSGSARSSGRAGLLGPAPSLDGNGIEMTGLDPFGKPLTAAFSGGGERGRVPMGFESRSLAVDTTGAGFAGRPVGLVKGMEKETFSPPPMIDGLTGLGGKEGGTLKIFGPEGGAVEEKLPLPGGGVGMTVGFAS